jgi:hypothetical protein
MILAEIDKGTAWDKISAKISLETGDDVPPDSIRQRYKHLGKVKAKRTR